MTMSEHSQISPSGFYRVINCPGSVGQTENAPFQPPSIYAERGTLQHEAVVLRWQGKTVSGLKLDDDELSMVDDAIDYLRDTLRELERLFDKVEVLFEVRGDLSLIGYSDIWGTCDVIIKCYDRVNLGDPLNLVELHIIDWKFGKGVGVYVDDNPQLLGYLLMALDKSQLAGLDKEVKYHIHLVQPPKNYYGVQQVDNLGAFSKLLIEAVEASKLPDAPINPGEGQCKFCPAAFTCKGRHKYQNQLAQDVFAFLEDGKMLEKGPSPIVTAAENAVMYAKLTELISYHKQLEKHGFKELSDGREFPGFKLVRGRSTRKWKDEALTIKWLKKYGNIKDFYAKPKMLSPAQIEKADKTLKKDSDFKQLVDKPPGSLKMVSDDDKREAVDATEDAKEVFKDV